MNKPRVMVALRDCEHVEGLVKLASQLAKGLDADLIALHVVEVGPGLPMDADLEGLDRPGRAILSLAREKAIKEFSGKVYTRLARAHRVGEAIVDDAKEHGVHLLVLGYRHPHRVGEIFLGSTFQYIARHAPCNVIVEIPPLKECVAVAKERSDWGELMEEIS